MESVNFLTALILKGVKNTVKFYNSLFLVLIFFLSTRVYGLTSLKHT